MDPAVTSPQLAPYRRRPTATIASGSTATYIELPSLDQLEAVTTAVSGPDALDESSTSAKPLEAPIDSGVDPVSPYQSLESLVLVENVGPPPTDTNGKKLGMTPDQWWVMRRRTFYYVLAITIIALWLVLVLRFRQDETTYQDTNDIHTNNYTNPYQDGTNTIVIWLLQGTLQKFDPSERTLVVTWKLASAWPDLTNYRFINGVPTEIFRDQSLIRERNDVIERVKNNSTFLNEFNAYLQSDPLLMRVDDDTAEPIAVVGSHRYDSFTTDIYMGQLGYREVFQLPLLGYPFEKWIGNIVLVGSEQDFAQKYSAHHGFAWDFNAVYLVGGLLNWVITAKVTGVCSDMHSPTYWLDPERCDPTITFYAERPFRVVAAVVAILVVNWATTISLFIVTFEVVFLKRRKMAEKYQLHALCFAALFALPAVRSLLPGAPEFGTYIDMIGILPNVVIISICGCVLAIWVTFNPQDPPEPRRLKTN